MAIMFYGADFLPRLRAMTETELNTATEAASQLSLQTPLHLCRDKEFKIPGFENKGLLTGGQVIAVMVFGLWVKMKENEKLAGALLDAWPIKEAVLLVEPQPVAKE